MWQPFNSSNLWWYLNPALAIEFFLECIINLTMKLQFQFSLPNKLFNFFRRRYILRTRWSFIIIDFVKVVTFIIFFRLFAFFTLFVVQPKYHNSTCLITGTQKLPFAFIKCQSRYSIFIWSIMRFNFSKPLDQIKCFTRFRKLFIWSTCG